MDSSKSCRLPPLPKPSLCSKCERERRNERNPTAERASNCRRISRCTLPFKLARGWLNQDFRHHRGAIFIASGLAEWVKSAVAFDDGDCGRSELSFALHFTLTLVGATIPIIPEKNEPFHDLEHPQLPRCSKNA